jgi:hypothetical protein
MKRILTLDLIAQTPDLDSIRQQIMTETRRTRSSCQPSARRMFVGEVLFGQD